MNKPISLFVAEDFESKKIFGRKIAPIPPEGIFNGDKVLFNYLDEDFELFKDEIVNTLIGQPDEGYANFHIKRFDIIDSCGILNKCEQNDIGHFLNTSSINPVIDINLVDEIKERLMQNRFGRSGITEMSLDLRPERPIKVMLGNYKSYLQFFEDVPKQDENFELFFTDLEMEDFNCPESFGTVMETRSVFYTQIDLNNRDMSDKKNDFIVDTLFDYMHTMGYQNLPYVAYTFKKRQLNIISPNIINFQGEKMLLRSGLDKQKIISVYDKLATAYPDLLNKANSVRVKNNIDEYISNSTHKPKNSSKPRNLKI